LLKSAAASGGVERSTCGGKRCSEIWRRGGRDPYTRKLKKICVRRSLKKWKASGGTKMKKKKGSQDFKTGKEERKQKTTTHPKGRHSRGKRKRRPEMGQRNRGGGGKRGNPKELRQKKRQARRCGGSFLGGRRPTLAIKNPAAEKEGKKSWAPLQERRNSPPRGGMVRGRFCEGKGEVYICLLVGGDHALWGGKKKGLQQPQNQVKEAGSLG